MLTNEVMRQQLAINSTDILTYASIHPSMHASMHPYTYIHMLTDEVMRQQLAINNTAVLPLLLLLLPL
jgi:hypothetical protein